jgi:hypothetical protein
VALVFQIKTWCGRFSHPTWTMRMKRSWMRSSFQLRRPSNAWNRDIGSRINLLSNTCVATRRPEQCGSITETRSEEIIWSSALPLRNVGIWDEARDDSVWDREKGMEYDFEIHQVTGEELPAIIDWFATSYYDNRKDAEAHFTDHFDGQARLLLLCAVRRLPVISPSP